MVIFKIPLVNCLSGNCVSFWHKGGLGLHIDLICSFLQIECNEDSNAIRELNLAADDTNDDSQ